MFAYCGNNPVNNTDPTGHASWGTNTVAIADGYCGFFPGSAEYAIKERNRQKVWKNTLENLVNTDNTDEQVVLDADLLAFYNGRLFLKVKGESGLSFGIVFLEKE